MFPDRYHTFFAFFQRMQLFNKQQNAGHAQATDIPRRDALIALSMVTVPLVHSHKAKRVLFR